MRFRRHQEAARARSRRLLMLFALLVVAVAVAANATLAALWWLLTPGWDFPAWFFETNTAVVLLFVLGGCAVEHGRLAEGGAHVARLAGGRPAGRDDPLERRLQHVVVEMAIAAGVPPPAPWVLVREDAINAFAAGWRPDDAVVAVTRGALGKLDRAELQGVVAHEIGHLARGDAVLNLRLIGLVWGLRMIFDFGRELSERDELGRVPATAPIGLALIVVGSFGWMAGRVLQAAVSREREFLADASAVQFTRQVDGLGGALRKVADEQRRGADRLHAAAGPLAHLFLAWRSRWPGWATHPPIAERLRRLYEHEIGGLADQPPRSDDQSDDDARPLASLAPGRARAVAPVAAATTGEVDAGPPAIDAFQAAVDRRDGDAERLARAARWHSPGELRAALLHGLGLRDAAAAGLAPALAATVAETWDALSPPAAATAFDALAARAADAPRPWRLALLRAAHAGAADAAGLRRWLLLRHRLRARVPRLDRGRRAPTSTAPALRGTQALALALEIDAEHARRWERAALQALGAGSAPLPPVRAPSTALRHLLHLQRWPALQRPRVARAWIEALRTIPLPDRQPAALAVIDALVLLDLPVPAELQAHRPPWPTQDRSL